MPDALREYEKMLGEFSSKRELKNTETTCPHPNPLRAPTEGWSGEGTNKRVRVMMTGVPMVDGAEKVLDIIENCGGLVVAMENCTGLKPLARRC